MPDEYEVRTLFEKSEQRLLAAKKLLDSGFYEDAVGRAYYSMFFAVKALLLRKDIVVKTHRGLISAFGSEYVQKGLVDIKYGKMLSIAEELREEVDYSVSRTVDREEAAKTIEAAEQFFREMKKIARD